MSTSTDHPDQPPQQPDDEHRPERDVNRRLFLLAGPDPGVEHDHRVAVDHDLVAAPTPSSPAPTTTTA